MLLASRSSMASLRGIPILQALPARAPSRSKIRPSETIRNLQWSPSDQHPSQEAAKRCLRCNTIFLDKENSPAACSFHGHITGTAETASGSQPPASLREPVRFHPYDKVVRSLGNASATCSSKCAGEKGLFALSPPHQGIDGEWTDGSGVIVYKWNEEGNRPNTGRANWKKRWSCCSEYGEQAPPCRRGWHVTYDDGFTFY